MVCNRHGYALREPTSSKMHFFFKILKSVSIIVFSKFRITKISQFGTHKYRFVAEQGNYII